MKLSRNWRRSVLVLHILCGVGWMGLDLALALLFVTGLTTDDGTTAAAAYTTARILIPPVVSVLPTGMLLTGIVLGLGTKYGLVQWTWVFVKLSIGVVLTLLVFVSLVPGALGIPAGLAGTATEVRDAVGGAVSDLMFPPVVSFLALGFSLVISIWKPWGRTRWGRAAAQGQSKIGRAGPATSTPDGRPAAPGVRLDDLPQPGHSAVATLPPRTSTTRRTSWVPLRYSS